MTSAEKVERILTAILLLGCIALFISMLTGCISEPSKKSYEGRPDACYDAAMCMYLNQKNPDKSICMDAYKECRAYGRYNFCKEPKNLADRVDFEKCQLYLNQK